MDQDQDASSSSSLHNHRSPLLAGQSPTTHKSPHRRQPSQSDISPCSTPQKHRTSSAGHRQPPRLSPSPKFREPSARKPSPEDALLIATPSKYSSKTTNSSLVLQMPPPDTAANSASPQAEARDNFESPGSVLPRHSRGLDFSRARTHLHHSTLPDQSTPGSSPIVSSKNAIDIPSSRRGSMFSGLNESPRSSVTSGWYNTHDRFFRPRSMGSATALTSDASGSSSDEDDNQSRNDDEDMMVTTPHANKEMGFTAVTPYGTREETITGGMVHNPSPMQRRFHPFRRTRGPRGGAARAAPWRRSDSQKSPDECSSGDGGDDVGMGGLTRRESISTVTDMLNISKPNGHDSGDEAPFKFQSNTGVVRRPVTRRSNLLPKTKGFARIKAALQEESAPVDSESRKEAEVIRQVRVSDLGGQARSQSNASATSPDLTPTIPSVPMDASDMSDIEGLGLSQTTSSSSDPVKPRPPFERRHSGFKDLFPRLHTRMATPPPPHIPPLNFQRPRSSSGVSGVSEDMRLDSPTTHTPASNEQGSTPGVASDVDASVFQLPNLPTAAEVSKKVSKRRRDDEFDPASIKRRAVSPGMSVHSSPVLGQSPVSQSGGWWTQGQNPTRAHRENSGSSAAEDRSASMGSNGVAAGPPTPSLGPKRVGMQQGMFDTNDGFTKMTLE